MLKVSIIGATGYVGHELVRILSNHPEVNIVHLGSRSFKGKKISEVYRNFTKINDTICEDLPLEEVAAKSDVVFTALPHSVSVDTVGELIDANKNLKIIDMSADFRYNDVDTYEEWYNTKHSRPDLLFEAVYGLCEINRNQIKMARVIGNPGCYTTSAILALIPVISKKVVNLTNIIVDSKSGVSGAGRGLDLGYHFCECTENAKAYKIGTHRHTSEIEEQISLVAGREIMISFTPHLIPLKRGIISTVYVNLNEDIEEKELIALYKNFYQREYFVRVCDDLPEIKNVCGSNFIDIGIRVDKRLKRAVIVSCLDNMIKGAAGQAVQNMNIIFNIKETTGLNFPGLYI